MFNRSDLQLFYQQQIGQANVAPATWNRRRAALRVFAGWARGQGLISYDPTDGLPKVEEVELAPRWLDGREVGRLERALEKAIQGARSEAWKVKAIRDRAVVLVMLKGGLREGEVCGLDVDDVTLGERKGKVVVRMGKGNKSRVVPLNGQALAALRRWLESYPQPFPEGKGGGPVFVGKGGDRLQERGVQRLVAELGQQAGIEGLTPHRLRHTCAKALLDAGVKLTEVAKLLGHSRLETTMRYTTPSEGDLERAVERI
jgi:site-specific recombinase XerD